MKQQMIIDGQTQDVTFSKTQETISITLDGKTITFNYQKTSAGFILESQGKIFHTNLQTRIGDKITTHVNEKTITLDWLDPYQLYSGNHAAGDAGEVRAVMPGRVIKILAVVGQEVQANQPILVLEAMKMENEIKSPKAGTIAKILVKEGDSVETGTMLIGIES